MLQLVRRERQLSPMRRIALAVGSSKVRGGAQGESAMYCREHRFTLAGWHPSPRSYSENQTAPVDLAERELQLDISHVSPEACFAITEEFSGARQVGLAESQSNGTTGMLRCTVLADLEYAPFAQS